MLREAFAVLVVEHIAELQAVGRRPVVDVVLALLGLLRLSRATHRLTTPRRRLRWTPP